MAIETIEVRQAEQEFGRWLSLVKEGVIIVLTDEGRPLARISPVHQPARRVAGLNRGEIEMSDDFDEPLPESFWLGE